MIEPDAEAWQALDEGEQIRLVRQYHRRAGVKLPNAILHAAIHTVVENQIAVGDDIPVHQTIERLQAEGLDRHEAIHAVGLVLSEHIYDLMKSPPVNEYPNERYWTALAELSAESWRKRK
jgi:hypothetical protein